MAASRNRKSPDSVLRLRATLHQRLATGQAGVSLAGCRVAVGVSGGRDSVALLHALLSLRADTGLQPAAIHVHHGLSPQADRWQAFVEDFCHAHAVPLTVERVAVPRDSGLGLEGAARAARYQVFARCDADLLLLGHHQDDQAETLLFNLLRGAGVHGAAAMPALRELARPGAAPLPLLRPWLEVKRGDIDAYIAACGLSHIEDESNGDPGFSRNHLRHEILPRIAARYPQAAASLANAARRFGEAAGLLDQLAELDLGVVDRGGRLDWAAVSALDAARQRNLLRRWLVVGGDSLSTEAGLVEFLRQCHAASPDAQVAMSFGGCSLRRWQGALYRIGDAAVPPPAACRWRDERLLAWAGGTVEMVPRQGSGLRVEALAGCVVEIRPRQGGEVIRLHHGGPSRPVRLLFQERGVPPWERPRLPYLWVGDRLAAIGGLGIAAEFRAGVGEAALSFDWRPA